VFDKRMKKVKQVELNSNDWKPFSKLILCPTCRLLLGPYNRESRRT